MSTGILIISPLTIAAVAASDGTGAANLLSPSPREVWRAAAVGASTIDLDFGAVVTLDTVFLGFTNATAGATWSLSTMTGPGGAGLSIISASATLRVAQSTGARHHGFMRLAVPVATRYLRLGLIQVGGAVPLQAGIVLAGLATERAYEYRAGRGAIDLSKRTEMLDGGFAVERGAIKGSFRFTLSDLDDDAVEELWKLVIEVGEQSPLLLVEGHDDAPLFSQLHYGLFDRLEPYEREDPAQTRWGLSIRDWV